MADEEAKLIVKMEAETGRLQKELDRAQKKINRFERQTKKELSSLQRTFSRQFGAIATTVKAGLGGLAVGALTKGIIDTAASFEKLKAQLGTIEGSSKGAELAFTRLQEFASTTPFQLDEVVDAYIRLKSRGIDPTEEALRGFGNTAASMGRSLEQISEAIADATTGEFERLKEFGVQARKEADQIKFTFQGVTTEVQNSAQDIQDYLVNLGNVKFAGGMERQMNTLEGVTSNFEDAVAKLALKIDSETGLTGALKESLKWLTNFTNGLAGVNRPIEAIEADIAGLQSKLDTLGSGNTRRSRRAGNRDFLQGQLAALEDELLSAQLASTDLETAKKGLETLDGKIAELQASIDARVARGEQRTRGSGRNRGLTDLGRDLEQINRLQGRRTAASDRITGLQVESVTQTETKPGPVQPVLVDFSNLEAAIEAEDMYQEQLRRRGEVLAERIQTPQETFNRQQEELDILVTEGALSQDHYNRLLQNYERDLNDALPGIQSLAELNERLTDTLSPQQKALQGVRQRIDELTEAAAKFPGMAEEIARSIDVLKESEAELMNDTAETAEQLSTFAEQAARNIQDSFADFLFDPFDEGLEGLLKGFIDTLKRMVAEAAAADLASALKLPGAGKGGNLNSTLDALFGAVGNVFGGAFGGGKAKGGPVKSGTTYLVGENGPELFTPSGSGEIVPNEVLQSLAMAGDTSATDNSGITNLFSSLQGGDTTLANTDISVVEERLQAMEQMPGMEALMNFGGFRADGGSVAAGSTYLVGENGPELYTPSALGNIVSNHDNSRYSGGGGVTIHNHVAPAENRQQGYDTANQIARASADRLSRAKQRGF